MNTLKFLVLATTLAVVPACGKKASDAKQDPTAQGSSTAGSGSAAAGSDTAAGSAAAGSAAAGSATAPDTDATADYFQVLAHHEPGKPIDPIKVSFDKFKVTKAAFDPKTIEGGTATLEVDLTSLHTGSNQRDSHLNSESYLDTAKFATLTIDIGNVKRTDDTHFTADAKVALHGASKTYPVTFEVLDRGDDWIRVRGEHEISRLDFKVGKPDNGPDEQVAKDMKVQLQLTLKKS